MLEAADARVEVSTPEGGRIRSLTVGGRELLVTDSQMWHWGRHGRTEATRFSGLGTPGSRRRVLQDAGGHQGTVTAAEYTSKRSSAPSGLPPTLLELSAHAGWMTPPANPRPV